MDVKGAEMLKTIVDEDKCSGCEDCVEVCPGLCLALTEIDGRDIAQVVSQADCLGCRACVISCGTLAIFVAEPGRCYLEGSG